MKAFLLAAMLAVALILGVLLGGLFGMNSPRFAVISGNDGAIWRLDNRTGEVSVCGSELSGASLAQAESQLSAHVRSAGTNAAALAALTPEIDALDALSRPRCSPWSAP